MTTPAHALLRALDDTLEESDLSTITLDELIQLESLLEYWHAIAYARMELALHPRTPDLGIHEEESE